jgi:hypothetical protein
MCGEYEKKILLNKCHYSVHYGLIVHVYWKRWLENFECQGILMLSACVLQVESVEVVACGALTWRQTRLPMYEHGDLLPERTWKQTLGTSFS